MAFSIGQISASVTADQSGFNASMNDVRKRGAAAAKDIQDQFRDVGRQMQSIGMKMSAAITLPLVGAGGLALKTAADYESLRQSMDILNKSTEEGARNFRRLKEFSARTPFQLKDLAKAQNMLQGFGMSADDAFESMSMIGDIAAVASGDIQGIGIAFGQAAAEGRLMTRDIRQLINQGVPAIKLLANTMDVAESEIFDMASEGKISFEILQQAFKEATSEGGQFADGMAKQAETLGGVFSTMKDSISLALGDVGALLGEIAKPFMKATIQMANSFRELDRSTKIVATSVAGVVAAIGPLSFAIGGLLRTVPILTSGFKALNATLLANPWYAVGAAIAFVGTRAVVAHQNLQQLHAETAKIIDQASSLDAVNKQIAALGKEYEKAAENAKEFPNLEAEDLIDPKSAKQLKKLIKLKEKLSAQAFVREEVKRELEDVSQLIKFINTDFEELFGVVRENKGAVAKPFIEAKQSVDKILPALDQLQQGFKELSADQIMQGVDLNLGEKIFPPGSLGYINQELTKLKTKIQSLAIGSEVFEKAKGKISEMRSELLNAQTQLVTTNDMMQNLATSLGDAFSRAALHSKSLMDNLVGIGKQLASKAIMTALKFLLPGGLAIGSGSFFGAMFGGSFHTGGIVSGSGEKMVNVKGGEGIFTRGQMRAMGGMQSKQPQRIKVDISGKLEGHGSELRAVINESQYIDLS